MRDWSKRAVARVEVAALALLLASLAGSPACDVDIGASDNEEQVGRQERGRSLGSYWVTEEDEEGNPTDWTYYLAYEDVVLSPDGERLLAMVPLPGPDRGFEQPGMILAVAPLPAGKPSYFPQIADIIRLNFSPDGSRAYAVAKDGLAVHEVDLQQMAVVKSHQTAFPISVVDLSPDGRFLVLSNLPVSDLQEAMYGSGENDCSPPFPDQLPPGADLCHFEVIDLESGATTAGTTQWRLRDIDFIPGRDEILTTCSQFVGDQPHAIMQFVALADGEVLATLDFPNCAGETVIDKQRQLALLGPTSCTRDPISVIDLKQRSFISNLPGFGPVVISQDQSLAVGFTDNEALKNEWDYHQQQTAYGLIFVDLDTLDYTIRDYGDHQPTYTLSPDGKRLYLYEDHYHWRKGPDGKYFKDYDNVGLFELTLATNEWKLLGDKGERLDRFVWTADGQQMFLLTATSLFRLEVATATITPVPLPVQAELINLRPQQDFLILGEAAQPRFHLVELPAGKLHSSLNLTWQSR